MIGIDEVGRGPLAGPVVVCALLLPRGVRLNGPSVLRDSKKLTELQRNAWHDWIKDHPRIKFAVSRVYPRGVERLNISRAANLAATRAFLRVARLFPPPSLEGEGAGGGYSVFLDGGLHLNHLKTRSYKLEARTIIKGDEKINAIKLASIVAKVVRDRFMNKLHKKYPQYGFDRHKGYGTAAHLAAIKKFGPSDVHRQTFLGGV
jgi:ribonuclease HII